MFSKATPFHDTSSDLFASVPEMKRSNLGLIRICSQIVDSVVGRQFFQCLFDGIFNFWEGRVLGCDAQVVCVDEAPRSFMDWLIIGVYVEEGWGKYTALW